MEQTTDGKPENQEQQNPSSRPRRPFGRHFLASLKESFALSTTAAAAESKESKELKPKRKASLSLRQETA